MARRRHSPQRQQIEAIALQLSIILTVRRPSDSREQLSTCSFPVVVNRAHSPSPSHQRARAARRAMARRATLQRIAVLDRRACVSFHLAGKSTGGKLK